MNDKKTEKDLSILDSQDVEIEKTVEETVEEEFTEAVSESDTSISVEEKSEEVNEKKKIKPWILITSAALVLAIIAVGIFSLYQYNTLATYDGGRITRAELNEYFETAMLAQGITKDDDEYAETLEEYKDDVIISLAYDEIFYKQLEDLNVGQLSEEELAAVEEECQTILDDYVALYEDTIIAELSEDYTESELAIAKEEFGLSALTENGYSSFDDFVEVYAKAEIYEKAYDELLPEESVAPTDEEVKAEYDIILEEQKVAYEESPADYLSDASSLEYSLYIPSGIRKVRHILIQIEDETLDEISTLTSEGSDDEADALYQEALETIKPEAEMVLELLNTGEITFTDAIYEYNDDTGMEYYPEGYEVCDGYDAYVEEFTEGSMSLEVVGEYTDLVATSYGYHIIEYYLDVASEIVPYEDVEDDLYQTLLETNQSARWVELIQQWLIDVNLEFKDDSTNEAFQEILEQ